MCPAKTATRGAWLKTGAAPNTRGANYTPAKSHRLDINAGNPRQTGVSSIYANLIWYGENGATERHQKEKPRALRRGVFRVLQALADQRLRLAVV
jgi:hypothetical protein